MREKAKNAHDCEGAEGKGTDGEGEGRRAIGERGGDGAHIVSGDFGPADRTRACIPTLPSIAELTARGNTLSMGNEDGETGMGPKLAIRSVRWSGTATASHLCVVLRIE